MQALPRFPVDAADRLLQRVDGLVQVVGLGFEIAAPLPAALQFFQRGQVDRAERFDFRREPGDLGLQGIGPEVFLHRLHQFRLIGTGFPELALVLFLAKTRFLFLEAQLADLVAQRLQFLLAAHALLFQLAQAVRRLGQGIARHRQSLLFPLLLG